MKSEKRKRFIVISVRVDQEEYDKITLIAKDTAQSRSSYLRLVGTGYKPHGLIDQTAIKEMMNINADLGRLGGLLKHLFFGKHESNKENISSFKVEVNNILNEIMKTKEKLEKKIEIL